MNASSRADEKLTAFIELESAIRVHSDALRKNEAAPDLTKFVQVL